MLDNIFDIIPAFMSYFVPGYLFLVVRNFAVYEKPEEQTEYFFVPCIVSSYVFSTLWESLMNAMPMPSVGPCLIVKQDGVFLLAILAGALFGCIAKAGWFNRLTGALFGRTLSDNLFMDLQQEQEKAKADGKKQILYIRLKDSGKLYYRAQLDGVFDPQGNPILRLKYYTVYDNEGNAQGADHRDDGNSGLVIPYSDILTLETRIEQ